MLLVVLITSIGMIDLIDGVWCDDDGSSFRPRESVERVRNCSTIDKSLQALIIHTLSDELLKTSNVIPNGRAAGKPWNAGGTTQYICGCSNYWML